jgi:hypothetical protein
MSFTQKQYATSKPFASFLSGIAGKEGIPMWAYYVNRGQLISGFGLFHKNNAIMEFFPANQAYENVNQLGFKTFLKDGSKVFECFQVEHAAHQSLEVKAYEVTIKEYVEIFNLDIEITYFTLPSAKIPGFLRRVDISFRDGQKRALEVVDGLTHILPANLDAGLLKNMSNTLRSWMRSYQEKDAVFYHLSASIGDSAKVELVKDVNTYQTFGLDQKTYITDLRVIYGQDTTYQKPLGLMHEFDLSKQYPVNQIQAAMTYTKIHGSKNFISLFSSAKNASLYQDTVTTYDLAFLLSKQEENQTLHDDLMSVVKTETAHETFNEYLGQSYMDNVLRGGMPLMLETKEGSVPYYIYSRKHGDLERDYNFFMLEPNVLSQGNGNFRDVLQNRRNDLFFEPKIKAFNIYQFFSFIQADGYNPLNVSGIVFNYEGKLDAKDDVYPVISKSFTPGQLWTFLDSINQLYKFEDIIKLSTVEYIAHFHEGYWEDHFTYLYDLLESYEAVYPDFMKEMLFDKTLNYFLSDAIVMPRSEKYVLNQDGNVRQYSAMKHVKRDGHWLKDHQGKNIQSNVFSKTLTLIANKFSHLDPDMMGLMYEGGKPGWNDAMNGLPGLFGSGVSELFELSQLTSFLMKQAHVFDHQDIQILKPLETLLNAIYTLDVSNFDLRMTALETYRKEIELPLDVVNKKVKDILPVLKKMHDVLESKVLYYQSQKNIETYITYEATSYDVLDYKNFEGYQTVQVHAFKKITMPLFLEGYARLLKRSKSKEVTEAINHTVMNMPMFDPVLKMYKTSNPIEDTSFEVGRIKAFTPGWLERESIFLHMTYKYVLGLLVGGAYEAYYEALKTNMISFLDPKVYGRSILENSSFIASSNNPDPTTHGQGFVARLSGSTAELLSMWRYMFLGKTLFLVQDNQLTFTLNPKIPYVWFKDDVISTTLFTTTTIKYVNLAKKDTWFDVKPAQYKLITHDDQVITCEGESIHGEHALLVRNGHFKLIEVMLK